MGQVGPHADWATLVTPCGPGAVPTLGITVSLLRATIGQVPPTFIPWNPAQEARLLLVPASVGDAFSCK